MRVSRAWMLVFCCALTATAFAGPNDVTREATGPGGAVVTFSVDTGTGDDENGRPASNANCQPASGSTFPLGTTTVQCTGSSFTVTVVDTTGPALSLPDNITSNNARVTFNASAHDLVDGARPVSCSPTSGSSFPTGTTLVTCTASDARGNASSGSFHVTVASAPPPPPPPPQVPGDITAEATSAAGAVVTYRATATGTGDDENGRPIETTNCTPASGSQFALGTTIVTCSSSGGNSSFKVHVVDTRAPVLALPRDFTVNTAEASAVVTYNASAEDIVDGSVAVACSPASGSTFPAGTTTVNCTASDSRQNSASGSFAVTVTQQQPPPPPPPPQLPDDITKEATGPNGAVVTYSATANGGDDENGRPTNNANCTPASGSTFPLGTTTVQCTGGTFDVTIVDTTAPALFLPTDITVQTGNPNGTNVTFTASASDIVDGSVGVACNPPSGSNFPVGTTTVHCSASDTRSNSASGAFNVTVTHIPTPPDDTEAPTISSLTATPDELQSPNGKLVEISIAAEVIDNVDPFPFVGVFDVTANEPIEPTDWKIKAPLTIELRADRDPHGTGRVYTVWVEAVDDAGNRSVSSVTVTVPHDQGGGQASAPAQEAPKKRRAVRG